MSSERVDRFFGELAWKVRDLSVDRWGHERAIEMVGLSPALIELQKKLAKVTRYREPVLITGESGVGKELLAQAIFLLSHAKGLPYVPVNCPQYQEDNLTVSELFGHTKGSFTGAVADRKGAFEEADGGVIFLDEIGDLSPGSQAMLLRILSTGELRPLGASRTRSVDVQIVSATNRPLNQLIMTNQFRYDLFFRLRKFHLAIPPLRDRADDWWLIAQHGLEALCRKYGVAKQLSPASLKLLEGYEWPGNVRQVTSVVTTGYAMAEGDSIEPEDFASIIEGTGSDTQRKQNLYEDLVKDGGDFWTRVYEPFMARDLNRAEVRAVVKQGLRDANGNYRQLLEVLHMSRSDYQRFMDFLRHHDLKPETPASRGRPSPIDT